MRRRRAPASLRLWLCLCRHASPASGRRSQRGPWELPCGLLVLLIPFVLAAAESPELALRKAVAVKTGIVALPAGEIEISREIVIAPDAHDLELKGAHTTLKASAAFRGRALLIIEGGRNIRIHDLAIDGNRDNVGRLIGTPPSGTLYARFIPDNGILAENVAALEVFDINAVHVAGFAILANAARSVRIHDVEITESGGFNAQRHNNGTGGILLENASTDFEVRRCLFGGIRGNGLTIRGSDRGRVTENEFSVIARHAIEVSSAAGVTIENNRARRTGLPAEELESRALCMSLSGFNGGAITGNTCTDLLLGAMSLGGSRNRITGNQFLRINLAQQDAAGIFVGAGSVGNTIEGNEISGYGMARQCVRSGSGAAVAAANKISKNLCSDEASVARLLLARPH
jgi:hypothetical protein